MRRELDEALCRDFPLLYRDRHGDMRSTCMVWGFPGDGWEPLIRRLSARLEPMIAALPKTCQCGHALDDHLGHGGACPEGNGCECLSYEDGRPAASQVKEKFGTLRFYMTSETDEMSEAISEAEAESARTCEGCGGPGKLAGKGWLKTTCKPCDAADKARAKAELKAYYERAGKKGAP